MKTLYLIRHAKSSWADADQRDIDRPLNERGKKDAPVMADRFATEHPDIQLLVSSPANRAHTTCINFARALNISPENIQVRKDVYEAGVSTLLSLVNGLEDRYDKVVFFGHNPGLSLFIEYLTGSAVAMPTCGIAEIEFTISSWQEVSAITGKLSKFDYPKNHNQ